MHEFHRLRKCQEVSTKASRLLARLQAAISYPHTKRYYFTSFSAVYNIEPHATIRISVLWRRYKF